MQLIWQSQSRLGIRVKTWKKSSSIGQNRNQLKSLSDVQNHETVFLVSQFDYRFLNQAKFNVFVD